jgi:hypothetical protein
MLKIGATRLLLLKIEPKENCHVDELGMSNRASCPPVAPAIASRDMEIVSKLSTGWRHIGHLWLDVCISMAQS